MEELLYKLQETLILMIPEKWERIDLYASISGKEKPGNQGELFFYFLPNSFFRSEYINCYEVPSQYNIDEEDYLELINRLYLIIKRLSKISREEYSKNWTNITIGINAKKNILKIEYNYMDLDKVPFNSYERHIIWRYTNLNIIPIKKEEKRIIEKYNEFLENAGTQKEVQYLPFSFTPKQNTIDYGKVLSIDEAINRFKE